MEIYSATLHTKYADGTSTSSSSFGSAAGWWPCSCFPRSTTTGSSIWRPGLYGFFLFALMAVLVPGIGHKALGARRWIKLGPMQFQPSEWMKLVHHPAGGPLLRQPGRPLPDLEGDLQGLCAGWHSHAAGSQAAGHGHLADLFADAGGRACFWAESTCSQSLILVAAGAGSGGRRLVQRQAAQAVSEGAAYQLHQP